MLHQSNPSFQSAVSEIPIILQMDYCEKPFLRSERFISQLKLLYLFCSVPYAWRSGYIQYTFYGRDSRECNTVISSSQSLFLHHHLFFFLSVAKQKLHKLGTCMLTVRGFEIYNIETAKKAGNCAKLTCEAGQGKDKDMLFLKLTCYEDSIFFQKVSD